MKKVLITGITGFLGKHLSVRLVELGWMCYISNTKTGNLLDSENLHVYNEIKFDYIFHLAAHTKAGDYCLYHKGDQFEINQQINTNILKYWRHHQPQAKMIATGTSCSYSPSLPLQEDFYMIGEPDAGLYTYAMTKRMLLTGLRSYAEQFGLKYMYYVPSTLYGEGFEASNSHFIFDLIKKIHAGRREGADVVLWGDGYQSRELIYIDDAIDIMINTLDMEDEVLNIGSGREYTIREYASMVSDIMGYDHKQIKYDTSKYVGVKSKSLDVTKLLRLYPDLTFTPVLTGLEATIKYYLK